MKKDNISPVICFGEVLWDMLPNGKKPGGAPLNVAIHLKKQGQNPVVISKTGNDALGKELIRFLQESGIDTQFIESDYILATSQVLVNLDKNKNATYEICEPVAWDNIQFNDKMQERIKAAELIIFGSLASRNEISRQTLFQLLGKSNATHLLDVNLRPPFNQKVVAELLFKADFIKLNDEELLEIASWNSVSGNEKELIQHLAEFYRCSTVCVTRGANGAILFIENKFYEHPGFKIIPADTVGAGDSFLASLVASLSKKITPQKALEYACATGAFVASQNGAVPNYSEKDILSIINAAKK